MRVTNRDKLLRMPLPPGAIYTDKRGNALPLGGRLELPSECEHSQLNVTALGVECPSCGTEWKQEYRCGEDAFLEGTPLIDNPYRRYSDSWSAWNDGWKQGWFESLNTVLPKGDSKRPVFDPRNTRVERTEPKKYDYPVPELCPECDSRDFISSGEQFVCHVCWLSYQLDGIENTISAIHELLELPSGEWSPVEEVQKLKARAEAAEKALSLASVVIGVPVLTKEDAKRADDALKSVSAALAAYDAAKEGK